MKTRFVVTLISMIFSICLFAGFSASAEVYSGKCGTNVTWELDTGSGELEISGSGEMKNYSYPNYAPWYNYRNSIKSVSIEDGVTNIGEYAFYNCTSLTSITIPDSVTSIGYDAFWDCTSLTSITIPDSVTSIGGYAFSSCESLTSITIPDSVTSIGKCAFYDCSSLTSITIPDSVTSIGEWAFEDCKSLTSITIPDSVTSIGKGAFYNCTSLTSITIPDSVTSIGDSAFCDCESLTSITIPDSVTSIGDCVFYYCESLTSIDVDSENKNYCDIDGVLFSKNKKKIICYPVGRKNTEYVIPDSVTSIGDSAFWDCTSLTSITIPDSVTTIGNYAFSRCTSLTSITIPNSVTTIGNYAFSRCTSLTSIEIPNSVTTIGDEAFFECCFLTSITIPDSVSTIGHGTFYICKSLTSITIPDSVTSIGAEAFYYCKSLKDVYYGGTSSDWKRINIGSYNSPLTSAKIHYNTTSAPAGTNKSLAESDTETVTITVYENKNSAYNKEDKYVLSDGAKITTSGGKTATTVKGVAEIKLNSGESITVTKAGYLDMTVTAKQLEYSLDVYMQGDALLNDYPIIKGVFIGDINVYTTDYAIDILSKDPVTITTDIEWGTGSGTVMLKQKAATVQLSGATSVILSNIFDVSETIYICAKNEKTGHVTQKPLKISDLGKFEMPNSEELSFGKSIGGKIGKNFPLIGGGEVGLSIPGIPLNVTFDGNRFYGTIGVDLVRYENSITDYFNINGKQKTKTEDKLQGLFKNYKEDFKKAKDSYNPKELFKNWKKGINNTSAKVGFKANLEVAGFIEGYLTADRKIVLLDGGVILHPSVEVEISGNVMAGPVPVLWEAAILGEIESVLNIYINDAAAFTPSGTISGTITVKGGAGIGVAKAIGATAGIKGGITLTHESYPQLPQDYFSLVGSIGLYVKAFAGPFKYEKDICQTEMTLFEYPSAKAALSGEELPDITAELTDSSNYKLAERDYLDSPSEFLANEAPATLLADASANRVEATFKTNVFPNPEPCMAVLPDGTKLAVWVDDNPSRDAVNRTSLYWSYFNGSAWSQPSELEADGTGDYMPDVKVIGNKVYLVWTDTKNVLSETEDISVICKQWEISASVFENGKFGNVMTVTANDCLDFMPVVFGDNDKIFAAWLQNSKNDIFGISDKATSIYVSEFNGNAWSTPVLYADRLYTVDSLDGTVENGKAVIAYAAKTTNDASNNNDIEVYIGSTRLTTNNVLDSKVTFFDGELMWFANNNILSYKDGTVSGPILGKSIGTDRFEIFADGNNRVILFANPDSLGSEFAAYFYDSASGKWSDKTILSDFGANVGAFSGAYAANGDISVLFAKTKLTGNDENPYGASDICTFTVTPAHNTAMSDVFYRKDTLVGGNTLEIDMVVENKGELAADMFVVDIYDTNNNLLASSYSKEPLLPGSSCDFTAYYKLADNVAPHDIVLKLTVPGKTDNDESDNTKTVTLDIDDINVENLGFGVAENGKAIICGDIVNRGYGNHSNLTVSLIKGSPDGEIIENFKIDGELSLLQRSAFTFEVDFSEEAIYYVSVDAEDDIISNNSGYVVLASEKQNLIEVSETSELDTTSVGGTKLIIGITEGTTASDVSNNVVTDYEGALKVTDKDGNSISDSAVIGTGSKLRLESADGEVLDERILVVTGDIDGDGICTVLDVRLLLQYLASHNKNGYIRGGDMDNGRSVDMYDLNLMMSRLKGD